MTLSERIDAALRAVPCRLCGVAHYGKQNYGPTGTYHDFQPDYPAMTAAVLAVVEEESAERIRKWATSVAVEKEQADLAEARVRELEEALRSVRAEYAKDIRARICDTNITFITNEALVHRPETP